VRLTALGLSFVKEVMELHQSQVELVAHDNGTEALLKFPQSRPGRMNSPLQAING
jgi:signal transduction histidine kinase